MISNIIILEQCSKQEIGGETMTDQTQKPICPKMEQTFNLIGKRWTGLIIRTLMGGSRRFADLESIIPHLSGRMLSERLKELDRAGIVVRSVYSETPVRIEYTLSKKGIELAHALDSVQQWAEKWI